MIIGTLTLHWPQLTWLCLMLLADGYALANDGKPKTGKWSAATSIASTIVGGWLLWCGGFFGP